MARRYEASAGTAGGTAPEAPPLALVAREGNRVVLRALDGAAAAAGLAPGLPLAEARARLPGLRTQEADPAGEAAALARLADWLERYSPWVALDSAGEAGGAGLWLDVTGCAHLFGGEAALLADLLARLRGFGLGGRAGLAATPGAAWALARWATGESRPARAIAGGEERAVLAGLPVAALRLPAERVELLARFGLTRIGDLLELPATALVARAGGLVAKRLRQALGELAEPISPRRPVAAQQERCLFGEPVATGAAIAGALEALLVALCRRLEGAGLGARRLALTVYRVDGSRRALALGTSRPTREPAHLARLFAGHLDGIDPGFGIDALSLAAVETEPLSALQLALAERQRRGAATDLAGLVDRLGARLGLDNIGRRGARESHLPERAVAAVAPFAPAPAEAWPAGPPRPLRLLARPEPVAATALLPDHPPHQFRWRRVLHRVVRAEGPERIAGEWWLDGPEAPARDYFRVEDADGHRFWLYRSAGAWYLQGLFG